MTRYLVTNPPTGAPIDVVVRDGVQVSLSSGETINVDEATYRWLLHTYSFLTGEIVEEAEPEAESEAESKAESEISQEPPAEDMPHKKKSARKGRKRKGRY